MGAQIIEKHFTLDKTKIGMDNQMSTETESFEIMIKKCNSAKLILGNPERNVSKDEFKQRVNIRRSIVAKNNITKGQVIKNEMI